MDELYLGGHISTADDPYCRQSSTGFIDLTRDCTFGTLSDVDDDEPTLRGLLESFEQFRFLGRVTSSKGFENDALDRFL